MSRNVAALFVAASLVWGSLAIAETDVRRFHPSGYRTVLDEHKGEAFLLVFWSLECAPCYRELKMLGELGAGDRFDVVFVSTDAPAQRGRIRKTLQRFGLGNADSWVFDAPAMKLRFAVDRQWYGELPRSYVFDAAHNREAVTGVLEREAISPLLDAVPARRD